MKATKKQREKLLELMDQVDPKSEAYNVLTEQYARLCQCDESQNKWIPNIVSIANMVIGCVSTTLQVRSVLKHEDRGNIVTTKSLGYTQKMPTPKIDPPSMSSTRLEPPKRGGK